MKSLQKKIIAGLVIFGLALGLSLFSFYFLIDKEGKKEIIEEDDKISVDVRATVFKEDGLGGWTPITSPREIIPGHIKFDCNITNYNQVKNKSKNIDSVEFFISNSAPDIQYPTPEHWAMITSFNEDKDHYDYTLGSRTLPDDTWYFITRVIDSENNDSYDTYSISDTLMPFSIEHFEDSITFTYLDINGRINHNSHIGFVPTALFEQFIEGVDLAIVYNKTQDSLTSTPINYSEISSNYGLLRLGLLSSWVESNSIPPDDYNISFIITLHLNYGFQFPVYHHNYSLPSIILDLKGPDFILTEYSLQLGKTYWMVEDCILSALINYTTTDFSYLQLDYMYNVCYPNGEWVTYNTFSGSHSPIDVNFNILYLRDDKIHLRFTAYDNLGNNFSLEGPAYWIIKDFNNNLNFGLEGIDNYDFFTLSEGWIDLRVGVYPVDNDITKVAVLTDYEYFELTNVNVIGDHIKFTEEGDVDIKLDPVYYNIFGSTFSSIPLDVILFQGSTYITSKRLTILATSPTFQDKVNISDIKINASITHTDNIWMSFTTGTDSYKNSHEIPYIPNNNPPVVRIYNSQDALVETIALNPDYNNNSYHTFDQGSIKIQNNFFNLSLAGLGEICTLDAILINGSVYNFKYFIQNSDTAYIKLLTAVNLDGIYGSNEPISLNYTISNVLHVHSQYKASFNFQSLPTDNYTIVGEFYDISGRFSTFTVNNIL